MAGPDDLDLIPVFSTSDPALLAIVKSALEAAGFPCVVQGEGTLALFPLGRFAVGVHKRVLGAIIFVSRDRVEEARAFLDSFE